MEGESEVAADPEGEVQLDGEDVMLLLHTLSARLAALKRSATVMAGDDPRLRFVSMYKAGQVCVLEQAVATLNELLSGGQEDEGGT